MESNEPGKTGGGTAFAVLVALSVSHLLNDTIQSLIAAVYPVLKESYALRGHTVINYAAIPGMVAFDAGHESSGADDVVSRRSMILT